MPLSVLAALSIQLFFSIQLSACSFFFLLRSGHFQLQIVQLLEYLQAHPRWLLSHWPITIEKGAGLMISTQSHCTQNLLCKGISTLMSRAAARTRFLSVILGKLSKVNWDMTLRKHAEVLDGVFFFGSLATISAWEKSSENEANCKNASDGHGTLNVTLNG